MKKLLLTIAFISSLALGQNIKIDNLNYEIKDESKLDNGNYFIFCDRNGSNFILITNENKEPLMYYSFEDMIWIELTTKNK